jgi:hypothetical protein
LRAPVLARPIAVCLGGSDIGMAMPPVLLRPSHASFVPALI